MNYTTPFPSDSAAFKKGYNRGYTLCLKMKKLSREASAILQSITSKSFHHSYGQGLQSGYLCALKVIEKRLEQQHLKDFEQEIPSNSHSTLEIEEEQKEMIARRMREIDMLQGFDREKEHDDKQR